jgi:hypothetical protein
VCGIVEVPKPEFVKVLTIPRILDHTGVNERTAFEAARRAFAGLAEKIRVPDLGPNDLHGSRSGRRALLAGEYPAFLTARRSLLLRSCGIFGEVADARE